MTRNPTTKLSATRPQRMWLAHPSWRPTSAVAPAQRRLCTHTHGSHIILIGLPNFLHDLLLSPAAVLNGPLHSDGPLGVVEGKVLQPGGEKQSTFH